MSGNVSLNGTGPKLITNKTTHVATRSNAVSGDSESSVSTRGAKMTICKIYADALIYTQASSLFLKCGQMDTS